MKDLGGLEAKAPTDLVEVALEPLVQGDVGIARNGFDGVKQFPLLFVIECLDVVHVHPNEEGAETLVDLKDYLALHPKEGVSRFLPAAKPPRLVSSCVTVLSI